MQVLCRFDEETYFRSCSSSVYDAGSYWLKESKSTRVKEVHICKRIELDVIDYDKHL